MIETRYFHHTSFDKNAHLIVFLGEHLIILKHQFLPRFFMQ
uniref:Uncharacterized protein n=1 Tax=Arundo donax TaxID=35708 RepID=A0A0A8ZFP6_ARUDO